jgi:NitT/TauT family transport system permease protein
MIRQPITRRLRILLGVISICCFVALYTLLSNRQHTINPNDKTIPPWDQLYQDGLVRAFTPDESFAEDEEPAKAPGFWGSLTTFFSQLPRTWIWKDTKATFSRLFMGLLLGALASVIIGVLMGCYPAVEAFFLPSLAFLAKIPGTAVLAVFFVLAGTGYKMYVIMIAFGVFPTLAQAICLAAKEDVPEELLFKARTLGASQLNCVWDVIFKHILPRMLAAIRLQVGPAMVYLIAAEMLVGDVGFGYRIRLQSRLLDMSLVYVYLILLGVIGILIDHAFRWVQAKLCPWF